jgi:hypothetical protein
VDEQAKEIAALRGDLADLVRELREEWRRMETMHVGL